MDEIARIKQFSDAFGPSGFEDDVIAVAKQECAAYCECKEDHMRNLYLQLKQHNNQGVQIMLDAHADDHIPEQESVRKAGGTNGGIMHTSHYGVPTIVIGIPLRYAHSPYGIVAF